MKLKDIEKAIKQADFQSLVPYEEQTDFYDYLDTVVREGSDKVIIRFAHEEAGEYGLPFFSWVIYKITSIGEFEGNAMLNWDKADFVYPTSPSSYTDVPIEAQKNLFYAVKRITKIEGANKLSFKDKINIIRGKTRV